MIRPEIIRKIEDQRREKGRADEQRIPAHRDQTPPPPARKTPVVEDKTQPKPSKIVEIQVA